MALPVVAIIGRPNVGKSTLVNRLCRSREAIVHDQPGVTRDRTYQEGYWGDRTFRVVDTGGLVFDDDSEFLPEIREQANLALENIPWSSFDSTLAGLEVIAKEELYVLSLSGGGVQDRQRRTYPRPPAPPRRQEGHLLPPHQR